MSEGRKESGGRGELDADSTKETRASSAYYSSPRQERILLNMGFYNTFAETMGNNFATPGFSPAQWGNPSEARFPSWDYRHENPLPVNPSGQGAIPGTYNPATGGIPKTPNPIDSAKTAIKGASSVLPDFRNLYGNVGSMLVGGDFPALQGKEYAGISELFGPPNMREINRRSAETGTAAGIGGSPANDILSMFMTDREKRARLALGSQLFSNAAARQPLNVSEWLPNPSAVQGWQDVANVRGSAPVPADAFNLNMLMAQLGLNRGGQTQRSAGGGGGGFSMPYYSTGSSGGYKGPQADAFFNQTYGYNQAPTLPDYGGGYGELSDNNGNVFTTGNVPITPWSIPTGEDYPDYMQALL